MDGYTEQSEDGETIKIPGVRPRINEVFQIDDKWDEELEIP
jgi:hypothetical protein